MISPKLEESEISDLPWIPITFSNDRRHKLEIGEKIKFGKQILKVLEIAMEKQYDNVLFPSAYVLFTKL